MRDKDKMVKGEGEPIARGRHHAAGLGLGVLLGIITLATSSARTGAHANAGSRSSAGGVEALDTDPANKPRQEYVASALAIERLRELAGAGLSPLVEFRAGQRQWLDTAVKLEDLDWVADKRIECGERFGHAMENTCAFRLEVVVEPTAPGEGIVAYSRAHVYGEEGGEAEPACTEFARCSAGARLGAQLPIPAGTKEPFGVRHNIQSRSPPSEWLDPDLLEQEAASADESVRWNQEHATDADTAYRISTLSSFARYLRKKAVELRNDPAT